MDDTMGYFFSIIEDEYYTHHPIILCRVISFRVNSCALLVSTYYSGTFCVILFFGGEDGERQSRETE